MDAGSHILPRIMDELGVKYIERGGGVWLMPWKAGGERFVVLAAETEDSVLLHALVARLSGEPSEALSRYLLQANFERLGRYAVLDGVVVYQADSDREDFTRERFKALLQVILQEVGHWPEVRRRCQQGSHRGGGDEGWL